MSQNKVQPSPISNRLGPIGKEANHDIFTTDGSHVFKTGGSPQKGFQEKTLHAREPNIGNFMENNQVLKLTKKFNLNGDEKEPKTGTKPDIEVEISNKEEPLGEGGFGAVYDTEVNQLGNVDQDKEENNIKYAVKVPKDSNNTNAFADLEKSELLIKEMVNFTKKTGVCATLQTLELMVPVLGKVNVCLSNYDLNYDSDAMLMIKVDGKNGYYAILGSKSKSVKPIEGYDTEISVGNEKYYCVTDPKISLDIAFQKIFALRGLHDVGLVYGDVKLANVMIQRENGEYTVRLIDIGSINQNGRLSGIFSTRTAAPEGFIGDVDSEKYAWNPKFDVFANAVDLPYIFFGEVAKKHLQKYYKLEESSSEKTVASFNRIKNKAFHFEKWGWFKTLFMYIFQNDTYKKYVSDEKDYLSKLEGSKVFAERGAYQNRLFLGDIFSAYEYADDKDVEETLKEYENSKFKNPNFSPPNFPENMTNAQKMRYMYWHLGFLETDSDIKLGTSQNVVKDKGVYPTEVIHSLSLLQMYSTDPNPEKRISSRAVERVLLHLKRIVDQWKDGQYRIVNENGLISGDGLSPEEWEMVDVILPRNEANKKNKN